MAATDAHVMLVRLGSSPDDRQSRRGRSRGRLAIALAAAVFVTGCTETSSTVSTNPDAVTTPKCQVSLGDPGTMGPDGGNGSVAVTTQPECAWTASSSVSWITGLTPSSGQGNGNVAFRVTTNDTAGAREGDIVINNIRAHVSQRAPCRYDVSPASQNIDAAGGSGSLTITTVAECPWSAAADVPWITFPSAGSGTGSGTVAFSVAANTTALDRVGTIAINGQRATISQPAPPAANCNSTITPTSQNIGAAGGAGTAVTVTMQGTTCRWTAVSNVPWIGVTTGANGTGNGTATFTVAANTGAARTGTLTIAGRTFTVNQAAASAPACTYSISSGSQNVVADGGTGTVNVTTAGTCAWTATSNVAWIAVTSGASGTGNGAVGYSVQANTGAARSGTITIAGQTFTVNQAAAPAPPPCTYSISPNSQNIATAGGNGSVNVTAGSTCAWTATSNAAWITITAGASGTGNGTVSYLVSANTGGARSGTLTIAGQTFTVNQAALSCSFTVAPTSFDIAPAGGTGTVTVTTLAGCAWTATTNDAFITITSGASGTGSGTVTFSVPANTGKDRKGNLTVAGRNVNVDQKGP